MYRKTFTFDGKRYDVAAHTQSELDEKVTRKKIELEQMKVRQSNILVKDWLKQWVAVYKEPFAKRDQDGRITSLETYKTMSRIISDHIGALRMKDVITADLQQIISAEYAKGRSKSHIDKLILTMRQAFKQARIDRKIAENPAEAVIKPKMRDNRRRAVTDEEREAILAVAKDHRYGRWIRSMLFLGLRPSETSLIQGKDIDLENKVLHVRGVKSETADRYVSIPSLIIDDYSDFSGEEYVFATRDGRPASKYCRRRWWDTFKKDLDIYMGAKVYRSEVVESVVAKDLTAYCLRHTYGTDGQASGVSIDVLAELMGHEDVQTTRKYYIHENKESKKRAIEAYEKYYQGRNEQQENIAK